MSRESWHPVTAYGAAAGHRPWTGRLVGWSPVLKYVFEQNTKSHFAAGTKAFPDSTNASCCGDLYLCKINLHFALWAKNHQTHKCYHLRIFSSNTILATLLIRLTPKKSNSLTWFGISWNTTWRYQLQSAEHQPKWCKPLGSNKLQGFSQWKGGSK